MILLLILSLTLLSIGPVCEEAENVPVGEPRGCILVEEEICCVWHHSINRYCVPESLYLLNHCTRMERAEDSMNAIRVQETWCYQYPCGWFSGGEGYHNNWHSTDEWSVANRQTRKLLVAKKFKEAKRLAKKTLRDLIKKSLCERGGLCDDHLEFIATAPHALLEKAAKEWAENSDI